MSDTELEAHDYRDLGWANTMREGRWTEVSNTMTECRTQNHTTGSLSNGFGDNVYWCDTCKYHYSICSGD